LFILVNKVLTYKDVNNLQGGKTTTEKYGLPASDQKNLMHNNNDVKDIECQKNGSDSPEFAVKAQDNYREGNDAILPDPKPVSVECYNRTDDRIDFAPAKV